jgi:hypothetical protein
MFQRRLLLAEYARKPAGAFAWNVRQVDYLIEMGEILGIENWFTWGAICFAHPLRFDKDVRFANLIPPPVPPEEVGSGKSEVKEEGRSFSLPSTFRLSPSAFQRGEVTFGLRLRTSSCVE